MLGARRASALLSAGTGRRSYPASLAVPLGAALGVAAGALVPAADFAKKVLRDDGSSSYCESEVRDAAAQLGRALQSRGHRDPDSEPEAWEAEAWERIDALLSSGDADGLKLQAMLAELPRHVSEGSKGQRALVDSAWAAGVPPHPRVCNALLEQLLREARGPEAVSALQAEMANRGVDPNSHTRRLVSQTADELAM